VNDAEVSDLVCPQIEKLALHMQNRADARPEAWAPD
jgi:hypothetical protein